MFRNGLEPWHLIIVFAIIMLVFGGRKLPELARGTGRALRIFKAETRGLMDDDDDSLPSELHDGTTQSTVNTEAEQKPQSQHHAE